MKKKLQTSLILSFCLTVMVSCAGGNKPNESQNSTEATEKDYQKTGYIQRIDPALDQILPVGAQPEILAEGFDWSEGPLWLPKEEMLLFSDIPKNSIY